MPYCVIKEGFSDDETETALHGNSSDGMTIVCSRSALARYMHHIHLDQGTCGLELMSTIQGVFAPQSRHRNDMQAMCGFLIRPYSIRIKNE